MSIPLIIYLVIGLVLILAILKAAHEAGLK